MAGAGVGVEDLKASVQGLLALAEVCLKFVMIFLRVLLHLSQAGEE